MHLDLPTLVVMESTVMACAGALLLIAWSQHRRELALLLFGLALVVGAGGILSFMLGLTSYQPLWSIVAGSLLALAPGLMWKAARAFDAKPAPLVLALLGAAVVGLENGVSSLRVTQPLFFAIGAVYLLAAATTLWTGRKDGLFARWPLIIFLAVHAAVLLGGEFSTVDSAAPGALPSLMSLFGLVYFETIVFSIGTAVFLLALVKERSEAVNTVAARIDGLTGIANRSAFMESAARVIERCRRESVPVSVMMFDLDLFKTVNDTYGHAVGDDVIRKFCEVAAKLLRATDVFGRVGGEEFAIVLPGSSIGAAIVRAERIRASFVESCAFVADHHVNATVSGGVSSSEDADQSLSALLEYADIALYRAKAEGRNRIERADQPKRKSGPSNVLRVA